MFITQKKARELTEKAVRAQKYLQLHTEEQRDRAVDTCVALEQGWTVEEFRLAFGKNWLDEDEIEEIYAIQRGETTVEYDPDDFRVDEGPVEFPAWCA